MSSVYSINKGINQPIEFKGLKAQYIWWLGGGLLVLLIAFAVLYICGVNPFVCIVIIIVCASLLFMQVYKLSRKFGQYGMMKAVAKRSLPGVIKSYTRKIFINLSPAPKGEFRIQYDKNPESKRINKSLL